MFSPVAVSPTPSSSLPGSRVCSPAGGQGPASRRGCWPAASAWRPHGTGSQSPPRTVLLCAPPVSPAAQGRAHVTASHSGALYRRSLENTPTRRIPHQAGKETKDLFVEFRNDVGHNADPRHDPPPHAHNKNLLPPCCCVVVVCCCDKGAGRRPEGRRKKNRRKKDLFWR